MRCAVPAGAFPWLASGISEPPAEDWEARTGTPQRGIPTNPTRRNQFVTLRNLKRKTNPVRICVKEPRRPKPVDQ